MRLLLIILLVITSKLYAQEFEQIGKASYYADKFEGRRTANGDTFSNSCLTAAHKTLPFGTKLVVTNMANNKQVIVTINDRGPFIKGRIIDVSQTAANKLDFINQGITEVRIEKAHKPIDEDELLQALMTLSVNIKTPVDFAYLSKKLHLKQIPKR
ncbi:septal ring lytic transglycosylase RlpA family protein [Carboxylicivirga marina]|uniref:Probable endolytic peptidoglycan transglycosylase RlpA n=1 Tax=Carboxylicivirga marina TaxID=2800988 RepID=A0ABS1HE58_9BACT|nr:septal ring lytic transglycosylase RlpA family protein [Carboxylicivirga marina]MBK3515924.1 septal ring lytic transglycosylase RlpA family protein [Carboxylicivirga marina]